MNVPAFCELYRFFMFKLLYTSVMKLPTQYAQLGWIYKDFTKNFCAYIHEETQSLVFFPFLILVPQVMLTSRNELERVLSNSSSVRDYMEFLFLLPQNVQCLVELTGEIIWTGRLFLRQYFMYQVHFFNQSTGILISISSCVSFDVGPFMLSLLPCFHKLFCVFTYLVKRCYLSLFISGSYIFYFLVSTVRGL